MAAANATDGMLARPEFAVFEGGAGGALGPPPGFGHAPHERIGGRRPPVHDGSGPQFSEPVGVNESLWQHKLQPPTAAVSC